MCVFLVSITMPDNAIFAGRERARGRAGPTGRSAIQPGTGRREKRRQLRTATTAADSLPLDAWARAILFLGCTDAVRTRLVSRDMGGAFDRACWIGPAPAAQATTSPQDLYVFAERVCQSVRRATSGPAPLWLRYIRRDVLLAVLAYGGLAEACGGLAHCPFSFGPDEARSNDNDALRWASARGHVAVLDRLAAPPYNLGQADARSSHNHALHWAAENGHVAVLDRLAEPPYSLQQEDARSMDNYALREAARNGHVAVLDRLANPPYSLDRDDARAATTAHCAVRSQKGTSPSWADWPRLRIRCNRKT